MHIVQRTLAVGAVLIACVTAQELRVRLDGDELRVSAPNLHFVRGKPLEQMRNGNAVAFDLQLLVVDELRSVLRRSFERFVISYDLWEEKFAVTRMRSVRSSASRLSSEAVEAWCIENVAILAARLAEDRPLVLRLDIQAQQGRSQAGASDDNEGMPLSSLIDIFSRVTKQQEPQHWRSESGPVRLRDLRKLSGRNAN